MSTTILNYSKTETQATMLCSCDKIHPDLSSEAPTKIIQSLIPTNIARIWHDNYLLPELLKYTCTLLCKLKLMNILQQIDQGEYYLRKFFTDLQ